MLWLFLETVFFRFNIKWCERGWVIVCSHHPWFITCWILETSKTVYKPHNIYMSVLSHIAWWDTTVLGSLCIILDHVTACYTNLITITEKFVQFLMWIKTVDFSRSYKLLHENSGWMQICKINFVRYFTFLIFQSLRSLLRVGMMSVLFMKYPVKFLAQQRMQERKMREAERKKKAKIRRIKVKNLTCNIIFQLAIGIWNYVCQSAEVMLLLRCPLSRWRDHGNIYLS